MLLNFDAGPAALPREVLAQASAAILEYDNSGLSLLELPHRGKIFEAILEEANSLALSLLGLNDDYQILWFQGGGRLQFGMIPMNFLGSEATAGYIDSGHWAAEALRNAHLYGQSRVLGSSQADQYTYIPDWGAIPGDLAYLHLTTNNTIYGTQFHSFPETTVPLVADMSSEILSRRIDYSAFSLIYAVAQKNLGPAGVTMVAIRKSMLDQQQRALPEILSYRDMAKNNSLLNTPPVFAIYTSMLMLRWMQEKGMEAIENESIAKATLLYDTIDNSPLLYGVAQPGSRSRMNVCFRAHDDKHTQQLLDFAAARGIVGIKGHRSVGGFRASLYNAISLADVERLVDTIRDFEKTV
ncbi:3-phosphoserine/phosphohydroxythreonine transaminase [Taibaiella chishuiensis]|uniref:Phosphoserine aminotransferase n=1 Tax=Taibaiella chishuiensis TaxID=1434707 RepID=A0A2P8D4M9_9BACT|nr:3-phosphoserine/phosphohydroxythreonine transaminase [Taibaiella chishuiensis]PSK92129.1 phosphoserine aminotransferase [Taibaiella chishuiensis]